MFVFKGNYCDVDWHGGCFDNSSAESLQIEREPDLFSVI